MPHPYNQKQIDRFWSNVDVGKPATCWPWLLSTTSHGYGQVAMQLDNRNRTLKAHKVAWEIKNNKRIPSLMSALHVCLNRTCCNPNHVFLLGDVLPDNLGKAGDNNGMSKLTERQAIIIKHKLADLSTREVSDLMGISYNAVWDIRNEQTWQHI